MCADGDGRAVVQACQTTLASGVAPAWRPPVSAAPLGAVRLCRDPTVPDPSSEASVGLVSWWEKRNSCFPQEKTGIVYPWHFLGMMNIH